MESFHFCAEKIEKTEQKNDFWCETFHFQNKNSNKIFKNTTEKNKMKIHNLIAKDRYKLTLCNTEREQLTLDESGAYVLSIDSEKASSRFLYTKC